MIKITANTSDAKKVNKGECSRIIEFIYAGDLYKYTVEIVSDGKTTENIYDSKQALIFRGGQERVRGGLNIYNAFKNHLRLVS